MNRGREWWIKEIAALIALAVLWSLALLRSATIEEVELIIQLGSLSLLLPFLTKELVDILLRIRLAPRADSPNVEVSGLRGFSRRSARLPGWAYLGAPLEHEARRCEQEQCSRCNDDNNKKNNPGFLAHRFGLGSAISREGEPYNTRTFCPAANIGSVP